MHGDKPPHLIYPVATDTPKGAESKGDTKKVRFQGVCVIALVVNTNGIPENIHIVRSTKHPDLDQKAIEAVRQYRFRPALYHGHPVPVLINIAVNFRIY